MNYDDYNDEFHYPKFFPLSSIVSAYCHFTFVSNVFNTIKFVEGYFVFNRNSAIL